MRKRGDVGAASWTTRIVPLASVGAADAERWRTLAARAVEPNAYLDPRFLVPAARRPDASDIRVVFVERDGELLGVHQFTVGRLEGRWPVWVVTTEGGFMSVHADRHHPLVAAEDPVGTVRALLRGLRAARLPGLVALKRIPADGILAEAVAEAVSAESFACVERVRRTSAFARRRPSVGGMFDMSHLSPSRSKVYRRHVRTIEREAEGVLEVTDRCDHPEIVEEFLDFQAAGWKGDPGRGGGAFRLDPVHERWCRDVTDGFSADGDLVAPTLTAGSHTVFMALALVSGGAAFGFIDAYNERFARSGPGALGRLAEWHCVLATTPSSFFDPAFDPFYVESTKLYPDRRDHVDLLVGTTTFGHAIVRALPLARRVRELVRLR